MRKRKVEDEKKMFSKDFVYKDTCETVHLNAYDESGRIVSVGVSIKRDAFIFKYEYGQEWQELSFYHPPGNCICVQQFLLTR